ncbi:hypothetical protein [Pleomorphomonas oryzae]|uniref:hypothetical protein n=1 Tax=Pleomorphomonas oryzae TaxID=261934 RepID=UPI00047CDEAE|nr:hypothetical protein [Pleomorphomonas oryzae]
MTKTVGTIDLILEVRWFVRPALKVAAAFCMLLYLVTPDRMFQRSYPVIMKAVAAALAKYGTRVKLARDHKAAFTH